MAISALPTSGQDEAQEKPATSKSRTTERRRGSVYWIRYWRRGREFRESSDSSNSDVAQKKLDKRMKEIWAERQGLQAFVPKAEKIYVDELLDVLEKHYKLNGGRGLPQFRSHLKPIRDAFGDIRAVDVTSKMIDDYIDDCLLGDSKAGIRPKAPTTINRENQLLGQAFTLGIGRRQILTAPHIRHLPERNVRQGFLKRPNLMLSLRIFRNISRTLPVLPISALGAKDRLRH